MGTKLTIDQGNTRAKIAVWSDSADSGAGRRCVASHTFAQLSAADVVGLCREYDVDGAILCAVAVTAPDAVDALRARLGERRLCLSHETPLPLAIDYAGPETLGMDRVAAAVGAWSLPAMAGRDILVADLGTAVTYDRVTADGRYAGGNIAPGIFMRLRALNSFTARLPMVDPEGPVPQWGDCTETALRAGAVQGVVAELEYYRSLLAPGAAAVLSGGGAHLVTDRVRFPHTVVHDLVNRGLDTILAYNGV